MRNSIIPLIRLKEKRQTVGADELYISKPNSNDLRPAFTNRIMKIDFKETTKMFDAQTGKEVEISFIEPEDGYR